jgi:hypothetical protein
MGNDREAVQEELQYTGGMEPESRLGAGTARGGDGPFTRRGPMMTTLHARAAEGRPVLFERVPTRRAGAGAVSLARRAGGCRPSEASFLPDGDRL